MLTLRLAVPALLLAALFAPSSARADAAANHRALYELVKAAANEKSSTAVCQTYVEQAVTLAQSLATESCSSNYSVNHIHGVLIAIRGLLQVGNVVLHRHGCKDISKEALVQARQILLATPLGCMSGNEKLAADAGYNETILAISGLAEGLPATNPGLYPPPPGAPPPPPNHCIDEAPAVGTVYNTAKAWLSAGPLAGMSPGAMSGGGVTCDPADAAGVWRASVKVKDGSVWQPNELVYVNINDWTCSQ